MKETVNRFWWIKYENAVRIMCDTLLASSKRKNIQSRNLKFVFTASFQAWIRCENFEILKYKINHEISFYDTNHHAVSIYEHFPLKNTIYFQT
jgi:hypothetical protein